MLQHKCQAFHLFEWWTLLTWLENIELSWENKRNLRWIRRFDWIKLTDWCRFVNIDWLADIDWLDLRLIKHNQKERRYRRRTWLIMAQIMQVFWDPLHILTLALSNLNYFKALIKHRLRVACSANTFHQQKNSMTLFRQFIFLESVMLIWKVSFILLYQVLKKSAVYWFIF